MKQGLYEKGQGGDIQYTRSLGLVHKGILQGEEGAENLKNRVTSFMNNPLPVLRVFDEWIS